jgi:hypothetical protein
MNKIIILGLLILSTILLLIQMHTFNINWFLYYGAWWHKLFFCMCFLAQSIIHYLEFLYIHETVWTIVGRAGYRNEMGRGEAMGIAVGFLGKLFFATIIFLFIENNYIKYLILQVLFSVYFLLHPLIYAVYIYKTKKGWLS